MKPLYGHQQDAIVGYNPNKPGRPSHAYHSYFVANIRVVLDMEVQAGNQTAPMFAQPGLWAFVDGLAEGSRPVFIRLRFSAGDCHWGAEKAMAGAEERQLRYLFKLKQSANVKKLIKQIFDQQEWVEAGQQWQGRNEELQLSGWTKARRVVVLRRPLRSKPAAEAEAVGQQKSKRKASKQLTLDLPELTYRGVQYEYVVLVTSLTDGILTVAQHYRDRGDAENNFDELKNQVGLGGVHDARPKTMPDYGADHRLGLQLVDDLHAPGNSGQTRRSHYLPALSLARHRPADASRESDHGGDYEHACEGITDRPNIDPGEQVSAPNQSDCGAVQPRGAVEADSQRCISSILRGEGHWKHWPVGRCNGLTAVSRMNRYLLKLNKNTASTRRIASKPAPSNSAFNSFQFSYLPLTSP